MTHININSEKLLADNFTPVGVFLKLRDSYNGSVLLESTDFHHLENCYSFICLDYLAGITIEGDTVITRIGEEVKTIVAENNHVVPDLMSMFFNQFEFTGGETEHNGFFGYFGFNALRYFESLEQNSKSGPEYPDIRFDLFRFIIVFNHLKDEIKIIENIPDGDETGIDRLKSLLYNNSTGQYSFKIVGDEQSNMSDTEYMDLVSKAKYHCQRGDVFQLVLSRRFSQRFMGDELNVYRCLRSLNPSPYLFYFDYGSYKIFGSSPESQIVIKDNRAYINPIAGTFGRTGDDEMDKELSIRLSEDSKENAEHVMLVDLARNDLSKNSTDVRIDSYKEIHFYSHVIHIVSKVSGKIRTGSDPVRVIGDSFPAGTLTGAPKYKAIELINRYEPTSRGFYGGCIGIIGLNGEANLAITIRSFLSMNNNLIYQAGAGIVNNSSEKSELDEVRNKLQALRKAIELAVRI